MISRPLNPSTIHKELFMKFLSRLILSLAFVLAAVATPAMAGGTDPLFVNLTSADAHRARMGISFGMNQLERGHPLTIFLNDKAVLIGSRANAAEYAEHQKMLTGLMDKGALVLVCPMCMKHYGVKEADLMPGLKVGNPELTGGALFKDNTKTMSW
jgi:sulfur relay (sulfurtransferase) complex TusBCD TusD component (DsrE family)